jgi:hypothetical protein
METILRDIQEAIESRRVASEKARADPASPQLRVAEAYAAQSIFGLQQQAATAFADINGWRFDENYHFDPEKLGAGRNSWNAARRFWRDRGLYFRAKREDGKRGYQNIAIAGQPYGMANGNAEALQMLLDAGFEVHVPPGNPHASIWYPGVTLFLVLTLPGTAVRWLPEQQASFRKFTSDSFFVVSQSAEAGIASPAKDIS